MLGLTSEGRGVWGSAAKGFANTVPGIVDHVAKLPTYVYRVPALADKYTYHTQDDPNWWQGLKRRWRETEDDLRDDPYWKYTAEPGDLNTKYLRDPAAKLVHKLNPLKKDTEALYMNHPEAAGLAEFGGNALGWAAIPAAGAAISRAAAASVGRYGYNKIKNNLNQQKEQKQ